MRNEILKKFPTIDKKLAESELKRWFRAPEKQFSRFLSALTGLQTGLERLSLRNEDLPQYWGNLDQNIREILVWLETLPLILDEFSEDLVWSELEAAFQKSLSPVPQNISILPAAKDMTIRDNDSFVRKVVKWRFWLHMNIINVSWPVINRFRALLKKPRLPVPKSERNIPFHLFLKKHIELPCASSLLQNWQIFLKQIYLYFHEAHSIHEKINFEILSLENFREVCQHTRFIMSRETLENLSEYIQEITAVRQKTKQLKRDLNKDIKEEWKSTEAAAKERLAEAGTISLPIRNFSHKRIKREWARLQQKFETSLSAWSEQFEREKEDWSKDLELSLFQLQSLRICTNTVYTIRHKISENIIPSIADAKTTISRSLTKFKTVKGELKTKLKGAIIHENRSLLHQLRRERLPQMIDTIIRVDLEKILHDYLTGIEYALELLPDQHTIFRQQNMEGLLPRSKSDTIELKELVSEELLSGLAISHRKTAGELHERLEQMRRNISELDQIVEFNLEAALNLLQQGKETEITDHALQIVNEGLERTHNQIDDLEHQCRQISEIIADQLHRNTFHFAEQIQELADNEKIFQLRLRLARTKTRERIHSYRKEILVFLKKLFPVLKSVLITFFQKITYTYKGFRKISGLSPETVKIEDKLTQYLSETQAKFNALPYVYQRLFRPEPLEDERFFVGREMAFDSLRNAFRSWEKNQYATTVLIGEKGSGKTTLLNFARSQFYHDYKIIMHNFSETVIFEEDLLAHLKSAFGNNSVKSLADLENKIQEYDSRQVFILENIQNLFLKTVEGFNALERFLLFISRTSERVYWISTCTLYSWQYLEKVMQISKYFQYPVQLGGLTKDEIKNILLKRHRVSGYQLQYDAPDHFDNSRKFKKLTKDTSRQAYLEDIFFKDLNELSNGNISVAILFWQRAIREVSKEKLIVSPIDNFDFSFLHQLPSEELFTLMALLQHEILSDHHHSIIFRQNPEKSSMIMDRMQHSGMLVKNQFGYQIHPFLYRPVVRVLKSKNLLH
ncbi:MAG: ATP-binding protein [Calditrichia bacterium]